MQTKLRLVIDGKNVEHQNVLLAMELKPDLNEVHYWIFQDFDHSFKNELKLVWQEGGEMKNLPANHQYLQRSLSASTDSILPDGIVEEPEQNSILVRTQMEWFFLVTAAKFFEAIKKDLEMIGDRIKKATEYDAGLWKELKDFWEKVREKQRDKDISASYATEIKKIVDGYFDTLTTQRTERDSKMDASSKNVFDPLVAKLEDIRNRFAKKGGNLKLAFEDMKSLQSECRDANLNPIHRNELREKLDVAFKEIKERRFGAASTANNPVDRLDDRLVRLSAVMEKTKSFIQRSEADLQFERRRIERSDSQLESQMREAKIKMIEAQIKENKERLEDMEKSYNEIDSKLDKVKKKHDTEIDTIAKNLEIARQNKEEKTQEKAPAIEETPVLSVEDKVEE